MAHILLMLRSEQSVSSTWNLPHVRSLLYVFRSPGVWDGDFLTPEIHALGAFGKRKGWSLFFWLCFAPQIWKRNVACDHTHIARPLKSTPLSVSNTVAHRSCIHLKRAFWYALDQKDTLQIQCPIQLCEAFYSHGVRQRGFISGKPKSRFVPHLLPPWLIAKLITTQALLAFVAVGTGPWRVLGKHCHLTGQYKLERLDHFFPWLVSLCVCVLLVASMYTEVRGWL